MAEDAGFGIQLGVNLDDGTEKAIKDLMSKLKAVAAAVPSIDLKITKAKADSVHRFAEGIDKLNEALGRLNAKQLSAKVSSLNAAFDNPPTKYANAIDKIAAAYERLGQAANSNKSAFDVLSKLTSSTSAEAGKTAKTVENLGVALERVATKAPSATDSFKALNAQLAILRGKKSKKKEAILDIPLNESVPARRISALKQIINQEKVLTTQIEGRETRLASITQKADGSLANLTRNLDKLSRSAATAGFGQVASDLDILSKNFTELNNQGKVIDFGRAARQVRELLSQSEGGRALLNTIQGRVVAYGEEANAVKSLIELQDKLLKDRGASAAMRKLARTDPSVGKKFLEGADKAPLSAKTLGSYLSRKETIERDASKLGSAYADKLASSASKKLKAQAQISNAVKDSFRDIKRGAKGFKKETLFDFLSQKPGDGLNKAVSSLTFNLIRDSEKAGQKVRGIKQALSDLNQTDLKTSNFQEYVSRLSNISREATATSSKLETLASRMRLTEKQKKIGSLFDARGAAAAAGSRLDESFKGLNSRVNSAVAGISRFSRATAISSTKIANVKSLLADVNFTLSKSGDLIDSGMRKSLEQSKATLESILNSTGGQLGSSGRFLGLDKILDIGSALSGVVKNIGKIGAAGGLRAAVAGLGSALGAALGGPVGILIAIIAALKSIGAIAKGAISIVTGLFKGYLGVIRSALDLTLRFAAATGRTLVRALQAVFLPLTGVVTSLRQFSRYLPLVAAFASKRFILKQAEEYAKLDDVLARVNTNLGIFTEGKFAATSRDFRKLTDRPFETTKGRGNELAVAIRRAFVRESASALATLDELTTASLIFAKAGLGIEFSVPLGPDSGISQVVKLANATGSSLEEVSRATISAIRSFQIEPTKVGAAINTIRTATANAQIEVKDFTSSLTEAGAAAAVAGLTFDETAALITKMSQSGIAPSKTGTALRRVITDVLVSAKRDRENIDKLVKIGTGDTEATLNDYLDKSGASFAKAKDGGKNFIQFLRDLQKAQISLPDLQDIVGSRGQQFINLFTSEGIVEVDRILKQIENSAGRLDLEETIFRKTFAGIKKRLEGLRQAIFFSLVEPLQFKGIELGESFVTKLEKVFKRVESIAFQNTFRDLFNATVLSAGKRIAALVSQISKGLAVINSIALVFISSFVDSGLKRLESSAAKISEWINSWFIGMNEGAEESNVISFLLRLQSISEDLSGIFGRTFDKLGMINLDNLTGRFKTSFADAAKPFLAVLLAGMRFIVVDFITRFTSAIIPALKGLATIIGTEISIALENAFTQGGPFFGGKMGEAFMESIGFETKEQRKERQSRLRQESAFTLTQGIFDSQMDVNSLQIMNDTLGRVFPQALNDLNNALLNTDGIFGQVTTTLSESFNEIQEMLSDTRKRQVDISNAILLGGKKESDLRKALENERALQRELEKQASAEFRRNLGEDDASPRASLVRSAQLFDRIQQAEGVGVRLQREQLAETRRTNRILEALAAMERQTDPVLGTVVPFDDSDVGRQGWNMTMDGISRIN